MKNRFKSMICMLLAVLMLVSVFPENGIYAKESSKGAGADKYAIAKSVDGPDEKGSVGDTVYVQSTVSVGSNEVQAYGTGTGSYPNWNGYMFTPKTTAKYRFYCKEYNNSGLDFDVAIMVEDSTGQYLDTVAQDITVGDFNLTQKLTKGKTYYICLREWSSYSDPYLTLYIEKKGSSKKNIKNATIKLKKSTYTYTGKAIKPKVTVKYSGTKLKKGTDYTLTYKDNKNAGTGKVVIKGKGKYTGKVTKKFTIKGIKLTSKNTKVTLKKTSYKYDGKAKKPGVTVKYKSKKLKKGTHYTVTYKNNVEPGTATVVIKGKGKYTGSIKKTFKIKGKNSKKFTWNKDNWNFNNTYEDFVYASDGDRWTYRDQINSHYISALENALTAEEYEYVFGMYKSYWADGIDGEWGGSCYGMSSTTLLSKLGKFPYDSYTSGASNLYQQTNPVSNMKVSSLITYYQMLQIKDAIQAEYSVRPDLGDEQNIRDIIAALEKHPTVLIGFQGGFGGHAVLALGYESGSWTYYGVTYNRRIQINDPNFSSLQDESAYIYYRTSDYSWTIPAYEGSWNVGTQYGSVFNCVTGDIDIVNQGGYLTGVMNGNDNIPARMDVLSLGENASVTKASKSANGYVANSSAGIRKATRYMLGASGKSIEGYNLADGASAYQVSQNAGNMDVAIRYADSAMSVVSGKGQTAVFDPEGFVTVSGEKNAFALALTTGSDNPTSWFTVKVEGKAAEASLQKAENGYILTADDLENVTVSANNKTDSAKVSFSTKFESVLIYEIDANTIGVKADKDGDGVFETIVSTK